MAVTKKFGIGLLGLLGIFGLSSARGETEGAPETRRLGLRDALALAVQQNPTLATETVDVAIADAQIVEAEGLSDFVLDAGATWRSERKGLVAGSTFQVPELDTLSLTAGITRLLPDGGRVGIRGNYGFIDQLQHFEGEFQGLAVKRDIDVQQHAPSLSLTFAQPLLRGFGEKTVHAGSRRAKAARDVATLERENSASVVVRDVVHAYWELSYATQEVEIRRSALNLAREQLRITQAGIEVGKLAPTEAAVVDQSVALREEEVLLAEQARSERALAVRQLIGMEIGPGEIELVATDLPEGQTRDVDHDAALKAALEYNPQLKTVRVQGKAAYIDVEVTDNGRLPQLDFSASAGPEGVSDKFGSAARQMATLDSFSVQAGLTYTQSLGNHQARGQSLAARERYRRVRFTEAEVRAQISVAVVRAVNAVRSAKQRIAVLDKATRLAQQNLDTEKARFDVGRATNFDILRRQEELEESQVKQARARVDYLKALALLEQLTGDILPRYGIALTEG
jgi:outer membrane protein TolC